MKHWSTWVSCLGLLCGLAALALTISLQEREPPNREALAHEVYEQIVAEVAAEVEPLYREFGVALPQTRSTIGDIIRPLLSVKGTVVPMDDDALPRADE